MLYVANICKKASRQLGILKRIGKDNCELRNLAFIILLYFPILTIVVCFGTYVRKQIQKNVRRKNEKRALRFIYDDYCSDLETLLSNSKMPTIKLRRLRTMSLRS